MRAYGNNGVIPEDVTLCIEDVYQGWSFYQCSRKRGHGKDGLYCKQHDPERVAARAKKRLAKWNKESAERVAAHTNARIRQAALAKLAEGIPTDQLDKYKLILI